MKKRSAEEAYRRGVASAVKRAGVVELGANIRDPYAAGIYAKNTGENYLPAAIPVGMPGAAMHGLMAGGAIGAALGRPVMQALGTSAGRRGAVGEALYDAREVGRYAIDAAKGISGATIADRWAALREYVRRRGGGAARTPEELGAGASRLFHRVVNSPAAQVVKPIIKRRAKAAGRVGLMLAAGFPVAKGVYNAASYTAGNKLAPDPLTKRSSTGENNTEVTKMNKRSADEGLKSQLVDILSALQAMHTLYYASHWQSKGPQFYQMHLLFERLYGALPAQFDGLAEKLVNMYGEGTVDPSVTIKKVSEYLSKWSGGLVESGIKAEKDLMGMLDGLRGKGTSYGLDNYLAGLADQHETNVYLLEQLKGTSETKQADAWLDGVRKQFKKRADHNILGNALGAAVGVPVGAAAGGAAGMLAQLLGSVLTRGKFSPRLGVLPLGMLGGGALGGIGGAVQGARIGGNVQRKLS